MTARSSTSGERTLAQSCRVGTFDLLRTVRWCLPRAPASCTSRTLTYQARGRRYCDEDIYLSSRLGGDFDLALCHPRDAASLMDAFEAVVVRNSGPVLAHQAAWDALRGRALETGMRCYNQLTGRGDMAGKHCLLDLTAAGYPVIPTVDRVGDLDQLPSVAEYVVKPKLGADSRSEVPARRRAPSGSAR